MLKGFNYPITPKGKSILPPPPPDLSANGHGNALFDDLKTLKDLRAPILAAKL
jgi:hypothetical protein